MTIDRKIIRESGKLGIRFSELESTYLRYIPKEKKVKHLLVLRKRSDEEERESGRIAKVYKRIYQ